MKKYEMLFCKNYCNEWNKNSILSKDQRYSEKHNGYKYLLFFDNCVRNVIEYNDIKEIINNKGLALLNIRGDDTINDICREIIQYNNEFFIAEVTEKEVREWLNNNEFLFKFCFEE
jgi:hypothetical protein